MSNALGSPPAGGTGVGLPRLFGYVICAYGEIVRDEIALLGADLPIGGMIPGIVMTRPGGAAANVAVAAAAEGAPARFLGHCGYGPEAEALLSRLRDVDVEVQGVFRGRYSSNLALQHTNGELTFIFDAGDRHLVQPQDIKGSWLEGAAVLHVNSYNIYDANTRPAVGRMVAVAKQLNVPVTLDVSMANSLEEFGVDVYRALVERINPYILFCNQTEGDLIGIENVKLASGGYVVQHRGAEPTRVFRNGQVVLEVPVPPCTVPYTLLGAGDGFAGGFLAAWLRGEDLLGAVEAAHASARKVITSSFSERTTRPGTEPAGEDTEVTA